MTSTDTHLELLEGGLADADRQDEQYSTWARDPANRRAAGLEGSAPTEGAGRFQGKVAPRLRGATPSSAGRRKRRRIQIELRAEHLRRTLRMRGKPIDETKVKQAAEAQYERELAQWRGDPRYQRCDTATGRACSFSYHRLVLHKAQRNSAAGAQVRRQLRNAAPLTGAPAQLDLAIAVIESNLYDDKPISLRSHYQDFAQSSWPMLEWAYDSPAASRPRRSGLDCDRPLSENAVRDAINGHTRRKKRVEGLLDRADPEFFKDLFVESYLAIRATGRFPNMLKTLSFDGTKAPVAREQTQSVSPEHERLINGRLGDTCAFGYHGDGDGWRGYNALIATDPGGPQSSPGMRLIPAREAEGPHLIPLLHDIITRIQRISGDPVVPIQYVTADRAFNTTEICADLVFKYGIQPVFPWHARRSAASAANRGIPECCGGDMHYIDAEGFHGPQKRHDLGLSPGDDIRKKISEDPKLRAPRIRFRCPKCKTRTVVTVTGANADICTLLPHKDVHKPSRGVSRYQTRHTILGMRNVSESINHTLKYRCWGLLGATTPRCVSTERQMQWYSYGRLLAINLKRLVNLDGTAHAAGREATRHGLDRPGLYLRLRAAESKEDAKAA